MALELLQKAHRIEPENRAVRLKMAKMLLRCGRYEEARETLTELARSDDYFGKVSRAFLKPETFEKAKRDRNVI
ncbi:MAG: tetratricopeptide repeat protein [Fibrella sp.]|nr:tetratricopeptide repeat protein [Armatimonadota bacterium]